MSHVVWFQREFSKEKEKGEERRGRRRTEKWFQAKKPTV